MPIQDALGIEVEYHDRKKEKMVSQSRWDIYEIADSEVNMCAVYVDLDITITATTRIDGHFYDESI